MDSDLIIGDSLVTSLIPSCIIIVIFHYVDCNSNLPKYKIITKNKILPILEFPPLIDGIISSFNESSIITPCFIIDFKKYFDLLSTIIFDKVSVNNYAHKNFNSVKQKQVPEFFSEKKSRPFKFWRVDFCDEVAVLQVEIESDYILKTDSGADMEIFDDIDTIYQLSIKSEFSERKL